MLQNIPTHVIAGPLGAGKTSLIRHLLSQRPAGERWAVLINEFGQIGIDAALLSRDEAGIAIGEVAGGCLCCVNGAPFQVGLGRLLRKARPDRLFIEPSGLGHPLQLLEQLGQAPWVGVLAVQPLLMVLDCAALACGEPLPPAQHQAMERAGLLILNKSSAVDERTRLLITSSLVDVPLLWTEQGGLALGDLPRLPGMAQSAVGACVSPVDSTPTALPALWTDPRQPICRYQQGDGGWSIGWRWHPSLRFDQECLQGFLGRWPWRRAKGVIHSGDAWQSFNGLEGEALEWRSSEWRKDSRIELIFDQPQPLQALQAAVPYCVLGD
ncbi:MULTISPECIES: CobW-like GTP-binding protein [unclassified Pseudomonas]|uniref:CobW-like GTP-binding protein n=1 Tax=unclassified Pseudomonas TaxID=196821 RepID=UPI002449A930|nr:MULTISPECIES: CobW-like GTP-binding protein [unclassified Pseudomonas]MDH0304138.1 CobW-like GTP-binding protein [Pseudomonas sp. GD04091]MDH1984028.1 CobW-like GTP-binding protein [Pseudomonas sp. GD03689]